MDKPKRGRKPRLGKIVAESPAVERPAVEPPEVPLQAPIEIVVKKEEHPMTALKIKKKLRIGEAFSTTSSETSVKRKPKPKMKAKPEEERFHREVVLPTHQEQVREEVDVDGFDIEYVTVKVVEINGMEYFRDSKKNKLFRKLKEKSVGSYVGRYDPRTEAILELPDSDCESV